MRWMYVCLCLISSMLFFSACNNENVVTKTESVAIIDMQKAIEAHYLYPAWKMAKENELTTQKLKENHTKMVKEQAQTIGKMEELGEQSRASYFQADFVVKMSEARMNEKDVLLDLRRQEKARIDQLIKDRVDAIEEEYRLPLFNLKVKIEAANPLLYSKEKEQEYKEKLIKELETLQDEQAQKMDVLYKERDALVDEAMLVHEQKANERLEAYSKELFEQISSNSNAKQLSVKARLETIPEAFAKTLASFDKQITEQKLTQEKLYARIVDDINSQVIKIAMQKKFTVVLRDVKINISAVDITQEVLVNLPKQQEQ